MALYLLKHFPSILLLLLHSSTVHAQFDDMFPPDCFANSSDTNYKNNLESLIESIATGASKNDGFFNDTVGTSTDKIYGLGMCYAEGNLTTCNSCLRSAASNITTYCPDSKVASYWLESESCFIRYSNVNFFNVENSSTWCIYSIAEYSDKLAFGMARNTLFLNLLAKTNASANLMASGEESVNASYKLYGLLQCTRDLNHQKCYKCLSSLINFIQSSSLYQSSIYMQLFRSSCYVHYDMKPFMLTPGESPSPAPSTNPVPPPSDIPPIQPDTPPIQRKKSNTTIIVAVVAGFVALLVVITISIWLQRKRSLLGTTERTSVILEELQEVVAPEFLIYDMTTIRKATDKFSDKNKIGIGAYGSVFKGILPNGQEIAVKRLSTGSTQGTTEFKTELALLVRLRHNNLVQLMGCCIYKDERMLCYEYLPNGSLDNNLFGTDDIKCKELNWSKRFRIIKGTCQGLHYLHEKSPLKIVHRDLKASNILLDRDMNPKIADFGLARLFDRDQTHTIIAQLAGTFGYIAPECSMRGIFSAKSDTFSFGILVLEIVSGRKNSSFPGNLYMSGITNYVWKNWSEGKVLELKDPTLDQECIEEVTKCIHIALLCLQTNPSDRPNMEAVANMLNSSSIASLPPLPLPKFIWGADVYIEDGEIIGNQLRSFSFGKEGPSFSLSNRSSSSRFARENVE